MSAFISVSDNNVTLFELRVLHGSCKFLDELKWQILRHEISLQKWNDLIHLWNCLRIIWNLNIANGFQVYFLENRCTLAVEIFSSWYFLLEVCRRWLRIYRSWLIVGVSIHLEVSKAT